MKQKIVFWDWTYLIAPVLALIHVIHQLLVLVLRERLPTVWTLELFTVSDCHTVSDSVARLHVVHDSELRCILFVCAVKHVNCVVT